MGGFFKNLKKSFIKENIKKLSTDDKTGESISQIRKKVVDAANSLQNLAEKDPEVQKELDRLFGDDDAEN